MRTKHHLPALILILLLGAGLRFQALGQDVRFHPDEAFFATFARDAAVHGRWMLPGALDKPPLSIYASALAMHFTAAHITDQNIIEVDPQMGEFAARLPNTFASVILIALVYAFGCGVNQAVARHACLNLGWERITGLIAALFAALSPFLIAFSPSAFTDVFMLVFMLAALIAALRDRFGWSGALLALGFASKQQALFYLPLILGVMLVRSGFTRRHIVRFLLPFSIGVLILLLWDIARPENSIFTIASANNKPERLFANVDEWLPRLQTWWGHLTWIWGSSGLSLVLLGLIVFGALKHKHDVTIDLLVIFQGVQRRRCPYIAIVTCRDRACPVHKEKSPPVESLRINRRVKGSSFQLRTSARVQSYPIGWLLSFYCIGYILIHTVFTFNTYDRYLLPIVPLVIVLVAWAIPHPKSLSPWERDFSVRSRPFSARRRGWGMRATLTTLLVLLMLPAAYQASHANIPFGRDSYPRHTEVIEVASYLNSKPLGAIIYDHWMGWEMGYYLGAWTNKRRVYYPTAAVLIEDAPLNPDQAPRYLLAPKEAPYDAWITAATQTGFEVSLDYQTAHTRIYTLIPARKD